MTPRNICFAGGCSIALGITLVITGCGNQSGTQPTTETPQPVSVTLNSSSVTLQTDTTHQFNVTVKGTTNTAVTWSVDGKAGGSSSVGTIDSKGLYTAPGQAGSHTITATSQADPTKSASAAVAVQQPAPPPPPPPPAVSITPTTSTLGVGTTQQFTATVENATNPSLSWSVDGIGGGNATVGTINSQGLYTAPAQTGSHNVGVTLISTSASASSAVTVFSISVSPAGIVLGPGTTQQYSANVQGLSNPTFSWGVDGIAGGNSSVGTISSSGLYTAPSSLGSHTVSVGITADPAVTATTALTVTNASAGAVLTYHNDDARDGAFTQETTLMPSVVNSTQFGKLRSYSVDGQIYAQPLFVPQLAVNGSNHNVVFVATENDTVYAFDADGTQTTPLWSVSLGTPSPRNDSEGISPEIGVTSTPVIDLTTNTMYVLAITNSGPFYLHALDITTGKEKFGAPISVNGSVQGTGWDSVNGTIYLEHGCYQRNGLALNPVTNEIYIGFGHCNHGWLFAYDKASLQQKGLFNDTPDGAGGGMWNGGGAPAIDDATGKVYIMTGVDQNDPPSGYNDSFLRLTGDNLSVQDFFQPDNESYLALNDADLGSGSLVLMPDNPSSTPHEVIGGGKDGNIFVVNRDDMGSFSATTNNVIQTVHTGVKQLDNLFDTPAYWNGNLYIHPEGDVLHSFSWSNGLMSTNPISSGQPVLLTHGATVSISSNGSNNGIVWEIDNSANDNGGGPAILRAYDANNVSNELYNSTQAGSRDTAGLAMKFNVPTVADGKVFVTTQTELDIYGLLGQ